MSIRYDEKRVKRPYAEHEYTNEEILELEKCSKDVNAFIKHLKIINPDRGEEFFKPYDYQWKLLDLMADNRFVCSLQSRQSGKTTVVGAYALWYSLFHADKIVGIVSNKEKSAKMILRRIKRMYESLPVWLKSGVKNYAETTVYFDNGSQLIISATSPDAFRGESCNLLIMDEFAFVPKNQAEEFWSSNEPTIAASEKSKIIIISTPNGMFNLFHRLYHGAEHNRNPFVHMKVSWQDVPGRDEKWADEQVKILGKVKFAQEYACEFLGSTHTVIDADILEQIITEWVDPPHIDLENKFLIYEKPVEGCSYCMGVDTAKGTGEHASAIQVLKIKSMKPIKMEQVAVYINNTIDVYKFSDTINRICYYYNNAHIMVENNAEGAAVVSRLWWEHENENLVNTGSKAANLGIRATKSTKPKAVLLMKKLIEDYSLKLVDKETLEQLTTFIEEGNRFFGKDKDDDAVSALYWAVYILEMNILDESFEFNKEKEEDGWGILSDINISQDDWSWLYKSELTD